MKRWAVAIGLFCTVCSWAKTVAIVPLEVVPDPRWKPLIATESRQLIADATANILLKSFEKRDMNVIGFEMAQGAIERSKMASFTARRAPSAADFRLLNELLKADELVFISIQRYRQQDTRPGDALSNARGASTLTDVSVKVWRFSASSGEVEVASAEADRRDAYAGSTDASDLSGSPSDKSTFLQNTFRKRANQIGTVAVIATLRALGIERP